VHISVLSCFYYSISRDAGVLTESVRRRPYQILLLDEFEKAHRDVWNLLLQVFDEGHLSDSHGRKVDFRNVIVIMTSNLGAQVIAELPEHLRGSEPVVQDAIMEVVRQNLSPELINRIDETVVFNRLLRSNMDTITDMGIRDVAKRLEQGQNMTLDVSDNAATVVSELGYDVRYGARPLKRVLTRELLNPLSRLVLEGAVMSGDTVRVRTRAEAENEQKNATSGEPVLGWISSNEWSNSKNDVVIIRNHKMKEESDKDKESAWDEEEYELEDGTRSRS
jgi:ATP-dependent Clp protease ATP-binding subunit ClpB